MSTLDHFGGAFWATRTLKLGKDPVSSVNQSTVLRRRVKMSADTEELLRHFNVGHRVDSDHFETKIKNDQKVVTLFSAVAAVCGATASTATSRTRHGAGRGGESA